MNKIFGKSWVTNKKLINRIKILDTEEDLFLVYCKGYLVIYRDLSIYYNIKSLHLFCNWIIRKFQHKFFYHKVPLYLPGNEKDTDLI